MDITNSCKENGLIEGALGLVSEHLHKTPLVHSDTLNSMLGHNLYFKAESLQKTGAFKVRGILHHLLYLKNRGELPERVVGYSTGNHAIGVAWASKLLGIHARLYLPYHVAMVKRVQASNLGAEVIVTNSRVEAEERSSYDGKNGFYYVHPSDHDLTLIGAGTACYEALTQLRDDIGVSPYAIFASCGGGGLLSGSFLAKEEFMARKFPRDRFPLLIGAEPAMACDAYNSRKNGEIYAFADSPNTIADGLKTLKLSKRTFSYIKQLDDFILVDEEEISYWTVWLLHLLKIICEPSAAVSMAAAMRWINALRKSGDTKPRDILIIISGGNVDPVVFRNLWEKDVLSVPPDSLL